MLYFYVPEYIYFNPNGGGPENVINVHQQRLDYQINLRFLFREMLDSLGISVTEFFRLYRMPQHDIVNLVNILRPYMPTYNRPRQIPLLHKVGGIC